VRRFFVAAGAEVNDRLSIRHALLGVSMRNDKTLMQKFLANGDRKDLLTRTKIHSRSLELGNLQEKNRGLRVAVD
jgi:hypothetical protein